LSLDIDPRDKEKNLNGLEQLMTSLEADTDVVVLPELFSTGFTSNGERLRDMAETNGGDTMARLHRLASHHNVAIAGSFLAKTASRIYNRGFFIEPSGDASFYDKRHLFSMSSESSLLSQGDKHLSAVRFRGWNIAVAVCYDLRFPVWCRNSDLGYDVLLVVANWPSSREYAWRHLLIARAIENQAYVIGVDRSGEDKFGNYDDMTLAADYCGKELSLKSDAASPLISYVTLDRNALDRWREDFTAWKDADSFSLQ
ncbi:MAG: nitrilase family protein, partial [Muribaculaceae bacterium]|nr:nitrilase family protein [Muribaculaceae bacterium]